MKNIRKSILIIPILLLLLTSCKSQKKETKIKERFLEFFEPTNLGMFGSSTKLLIYANFDECGEWGGHKEAFEIFAKKDLTFYAKYQRTKVDCNLYYQSPEFQQSDISKEFQLSEDNIIAVNNYISTLVKSKFNETHPGHAGQTFGVVKSDSTLMIKVYDDKKENLDNYNKLLESFKIEKVSYEYR